MAKKGRKEQRGRHESRRMYSRLVRGPGCRAETWQLDLAMKILSVTRMSSFRRVTKWAVNSLEGKKARTKYRQLVEGEVNQETRQGQGTCASKGSFYLLACILAFQVEDSRTCFSTDGRPWAASWEVKTLILETLHIFKQENSMMKSVLRFVWKELPINCIKLEKVYIAVETAGCHPEWA